MFGNTKKATIESDILIINGNLSFLFKYIYIYVKKRLPTQEIFKKNVAPTMC